MRTIGTVGQGRGKEKMRVDQAMRPDQKDFVHDIGRVYFAVKEEEVLGGMMKSSLIVSVSIYP